MTSIVLVLLTAAVGVAPSPLIGLETSPVLASAEAGAEEEPMLCCLANPRYAGICREECTDEATCEDILAYLNNPMSIGKKYCGGTDIRGGWELVDCDGAEEGEGSEEQSARRH